MDESHRILPKTSRRYHPETHFTCFRTVLFCPNLQFRSITLLPLLLPKGTNLEKANDPLLTKMSERHRNKKFYPSWRTTPGPLLRIWCNLFGKNSSSIKFPANPSSETAADRPGFFVVYFFFGGKGRGTKSQRRQDRRDERGGGGRTADRLDGAPHQQLLCQNA